MSKEPFVFRKAVQIGKSVAVVLPPETKIEKGDYIKLYFSKGGFKGRKVNGE